MKRTARCHCGALTVVAAGEPEWVNICHCKACQRRTGAVLHSGAYFAAAAVTIVGASKTYTRPADSGYAISFHFCPECGSNVYWQASRFPRHFGVAVGAFADPTFPSRRFRFGKSQCTDSFAWRPGSSAFLKGASARHSTQIREASVCLRGG